MSRVFKTMGSKVSPFVFNSKSKAWEATSTSSHSGRATPSARPLTIATLNVWFDKYQIMNRFKGQMEILKEKKPDIVVLQEVTADYVDALLSKDDSSWIREGYWVSVGTSSDASVLPYGVIMLGKLELMPYHLTLNSLPTRMGRKVLIGEFKFKQEKKHCKLAVATVHLESLDSPDLRRSQLEIIVDLLKDFPSAIVLGDFNFDEEHLFDDVLTIRKLHQEGKTTSLLTDLPPRKETENVVLTQACPQYVDLWKQFHPNDKGYTFDTVTNEMLFADRYEQMRYDRIIAKFNDDDDKKKQWQACSIQIFANMPLGKHLVDDLIVFPSDHFGLLTDVEPIVH